MKVVFRKLKIIEFLMTRHAHFTTKVDVRWWWRFKRIYIMTTTYSLSLKYSTFDYDSFTLFTQNSVYIFISFYLIFVVSISFLLSCHFLTLQVQCTRPQTLQCRPQNNEYYFPTLLIIMTNLMLFDYSLLTFCLKI
jgi:hypothetical protein